MLQIYRWKRQEVELQQRRTIFAVGFRCQLSTWFAWLVGCQQAITFMRSRFQVARHKAIRSEAGGSWDNLTPGWWYANSQMTHPCGINNIGNPLFPGSFGSHKVKASLATVKYRLRPNCHPPLSQPPEYWDDRYGEWHQSSLPFIILFSSPCLPMIQKLACRFAAKTTCVPVACKVKFIYIISPWSIFN